MTVIDVAAMLSVHQKSQKSGPPAPCALWPVDLKLTHLDWNPEATLIHFQGQYLTICELDYKILQGEIQNIPKTKASVDIGEFCLVEDLSSARWYRGRVQNRKADLLDVFLIDHGNVLSVDMANISSCSNDLFILPPKIVCGFLANVLLLQSCSHSTMDKYFSSLIGRNVTGYIQALLPHKVLLLEAPDINTDLVRCGFGRHMDTDTFLLLVEMLTEVPLKQREPVPDLLIEKPTGQEFRFKASGLQGYEDFLSSCGPKLRCGIHVKVRVTAAVSPQLFYCQMTNMEKDLQEMSMKLAAVCEYRTKKHNHPPENLGLLCSIKSKDGKWYRGFVQFLPVNSHVRVLLIDYGFFESVKVENIYRLPPDFYSSPIMAFPCSLSCLSDQDEAVKTQQLSFLKEGLLGRVLDVEIRHFDEEQHLYSITVTGAEDNHEKEPEPIQEPPRMKVERHESSPQGGYLYYETIMGEALGKILETEEVQLHSVFVGYVEYIQNPSQFWIRTQKRNEEFEEMMTKMSDHFSQVKLDEDVLLNPEIGTLCCAVHEEDMHFYRGVVTDTLQHGAEVLFIDFGNIEKVPHMLIKKIPEAFASKPAFAFCGSLVNVFPLDEVWNSSSSDFFKKAVSNKALLICVVQMRKNKFVVDLYEMGSDNSQSISELMVTSKHAEYWNNIPIEPVVQNDTDVAEKTRRPGYSMRSDIGAKTELTEACKEEEEKPCNEPETAQTSASFKPLNIKPGCEFAVCCSYTNTPSDFWCQPLNKVAALKELMDKVQQYYSTHTVTLQSGDSCCVAKSPQDGRWYRAFIIEKHASHARVLLIDFGCHIQVSNHSLQAIMPDYVYLERQAFRCSLHHLIEPADPKYYGDWSPEACNLLKDFTLNSTSGLTCKVVSQLNVRNKGLCNVVDLCNTQSQQTITNLLLEQGLARVANISTKQLSTAFPESFVYSSYDLNPGNEEQFFITHVSSQGEVYCQLERNAEIIKELEKKISNESEKMMHASEKAVTGKLCLAKYFDGKWYRGLVHPVQSPLHLSVFFVDYGNTSISEKTQVMFIPRHSADLLFIPMQAVRCSLALVPKEELYADVKEWLSGVILNKEVRANIVGKSETGSFDVELFDGEVNINEKVKELILSLSPKPKAAVSLDMCSTKAKRKSQNVKTAAKYKSGSKWHSSKSPPLNAGRGPKKKETTKNYVHGKAKNKNNKGKGQNEDCATMKPWTNHQVKQQRENPVSKAKSMQVQHTEEPEIPQLSHLHDRKVSAGFKAKCFVSHIDSISSFFLQLSEDEPAILKMREVLNTAIFRDSLKATTSLRINDLTLAEYEEDGALYRSVVRSFEGSSGCTVEFVDYGNSAVVEKEKIYSLPKDYLSQPRFSISCSLLDKNMYNSDASFIDAEMEKPLMVEFVHQSGTQWQVRVEILNEAVDCPVALEAPNESSTESRKEQASVSPSETEEKEQSFERSLLRKELGATRAATLERMVPTVADENLMLKPPPATLSPKLKHHRKTPVRNKTDKNQKTVKSSVKAKTDGADAVTHLTIQAKDTETGTVLSVLSNCNFYIRLNKSREMLTALESLIDDNLCMCEMVAEENVKQGLKCLVQVHKDKQWLRAVVQLVGQDKCQVLLVDHGITEELPRGSIRRQCSSLSKIPNLAVLCKVDWFRLSEGLDSDALCCEALKPMIGKEVKLVFVGYSETDHLWKVQMVVNGPFLARQITASPQQNKEMIPSAAETQKTEGKSSVDTSKLDFAPIEIDKGYSGFAAAVTTPFDFCVVLEDFLLVMNKVSIMLHDLPGQMSPLPEAHLTPGTCCLLKSDTKNKWCRAEIVSGGSTVVLNLVDYGHYEYMPYTECFKLKRLPEEIKKLPKVTYPCILRGVKPTRVDGQWTDEAAVFFQQCFYQKNLQIFFKECVSNTHWKVDVLLDGVHVAKELVDAGHASYVDIVLGLRFQEQSRCKAAPHRSDSEGDCDQQDRGSHTKSAFSMLSVVEAETKMLFGTTSG